MTEDTERTYVVIVRYANSVDVYSAKGTNQTLAIRQVLECITVNTEDITAYPVSDTIPAQFHLTVITG